MSIFFAMISTLLIFAPAGFTLAAAPGCRSLFGESPHLERVKIFQKKSMQASEGLSLKDLEVLFSQNKYKVPGPLRSKWQEIEDAGSLILKNMTSPEFQKIWKKTVSIRSENSRSFNESFEKAEAYMYQRVIAKSDIDEGFIMEINRRLRSGPRDNELFGATNLHRSMDRPGQYRAWNIHVGGYSLLRPEDVEAGIKSLLAWYYKSQKTMSAVDLAIQFSSRFISIHPFSDANGRTGRLLVDFILLRNSILPPIYYNRKDVPEDAVTAFGGEANIPSWSRVYNEFTVGLDNAIKLFE